jgi:antitoxin Phd
MPKNPVLRSNRESSVPTFVNHRGELVQGTSISATNVKNEFGQALETVMQGGLVIITKHADPKAVLISMDEFNALSRASRARLDTLTAEFDALLDRMQTPESRSAMKAAFNATPEELGRSALQALRRRE